jgi:hypothetical protein
MKYSDFFARYASNPLIDLVHLKLFEKDFLSKQLFDRKNKGYITKLTDRYRLFTQKHHHPLTKISNTLIQPSYLSTHWALRYYNIIPEHVSVFTACTTAKTKTYDTSVWRFVYHHIKPSLFWGYEIYDGILIAQVEKAICDFLYLNPGHHTLDDLTDSLRRNLFVLSDIVDCDRLARYANHYPRTVQSVIHRLIEAIHHTKNI